MPANFAGVEKKSLRASEQDRPDVARHRRRWRVWQRYMDAERFVFIDETAATTAMTRRSGWSPKGERLVDAAPAGKRDHCTFRLEWADDRRGLSCLRRAGARA